MDDLDSSEPVAIPITDTLDLHFGEPDFAGVVDFLCREREFSKERVTAALDRAFAERTLW